MIKRRAALAEAPLLAWGERRIDRRDPPNKRRLATLMAGGVALIGLTIVAPSAPRLIWNASASAPIGLYWIDARSEIGAGDIVAAYAPPAARRLAAERGYLPANVPLVKAVGAVAGDDVCAFGQEILINSRQVGDRQLVDGQGRPMPAWNGCVRLRGRMLFLFAFGKPEAFDGRYFGVTQASDIIGKAQLLWAR
ncbi:MULTISPECIES: S26 family signal peptidase [unclassified Sphingomonas]|uniref:S26 family signal peptidase n=1 Tax=unclassified Sphingomonas TaxID=196159 RepID=UPI0006FFF589|nr:MULTISPECIES: S26 family signal peptidase [unclassified Sphingomonas]KQX19173.1 S26 family signal peptidase [Sphingomonas sp. Root1294]KQY65374.1 S26 family signal peptidase [Sphingomonas sp. Root50]KRB95331.1 S26 family signal peptidase [Sphingomonas sp. Root720]